MKMLKHTNKKLSRNQQQQFSDFSAIFLFLFISNRFSHAFFFVCSPNVTDMRAFGVAFPATGSFTRLLMRRFWFI